MSHATVKKLESILPALNSKIDSLGGVAGRKEIESLYGRQIIALAVQRGHFKSVTVIRKRADSRTVKFSVICNSKWDRKTKPAWME